jgi:uncharacterized repeat protein (TIGR01451 family)
MKLTILSTIGLLSIAASVLQSLNIPLIGPFTAPAVAQEQNEQRAIKLDISQSKKVGSKLLPIGNTSVKPGDVIVYSIVASNTSDRTIKKLNIDQVIKPGTVYEKGSATPTTGAELSFSIDGGSSFSGQPIINKKPAAASAYTNVRWLFSSFAPKSKSTVRYAVTIR